MRAHVLYSFALSVIFLVSCAVERQGNDIEINHGQDDVRGKCIYVSVGEGACKPNLHRFFGSPEDYLGMKVSVSAFATHSSRGSMLIYSESSLACDALDFSAFEVFPSGVISEGLEDRLRHSGVARVVVTGEVSGVGMGGLPVIGKIDKATIVLADDGGIVFLESSTKIESGEAKGSVIGERRIPKCLN